MRIEIPALHKVPRDLDKPAAPLPPPVVVVPAIEHSPASPHTSSKFVLLSVGAGALVLLGGGLGFELWAEGQP